MNRKEIFKETNETYNRLATDTSFLPSYPTPFYESGNSAGSCHRAFILGLLRIEQMVCEVLSSTEPAFICKEDRSGKEKVLGLFLSKYFFEVTELFELYDVEYSYSAQVTLFCSCCFKLQLGQEYFFKPTLLTNRNIRQFEVFNELIELLRTDSRSKEFQSHLRRQTEKPRVRLRSAEKLVRKMLEKRTRFDAIRIDLSFDYSLASDVTLQSAKQCIARLFNNRRHKPRLFDNYLGGLWKLEWAPVKGYHFHLLLFFKDIKKDAGLAFLLIDYWKRVITKGMGIGFNCNAKKHEYQRLGIGRIELKDEAKIRILLEDVIAYMAKTDQSLLATRLKGERIFMPCPGPKRGRGGRPRTYYDE